MRTRDKQRLARSIIATFGHATEDELTHGLQWYREAHELARELDPADPVRGAAVIAVLSPMTQWERNVRLARDAYAGLPLGCLSSNATKAARILAGDDPDSVVKGQKVRAFWRAIMDPSEPSNVVIDRHAVEVAFGKVMTDDERNKILDVKGGYQSVCERYAFAAELLPGELSPVDVQAVTWVVWRRLKKGLA